MAEFSSTFAAVLTLGKIVDSENWFCGSYRLRDGYVGVRNVF